LRVLCDSRQHQQARQPAADTAQHVAKNNNREPV